MRCERGGTKGAADRPQRIKSTLIPLDPPNPRSGSIAAELPRCFRILVDYAGCGRIMYRLARQIFGGGAANLRQGRGEFETGARRKFSRGVRFAAEGGVFGLESF